MNLDLTAKLGSTTIGEEDLKLKKEIRSELISNQRKQLPVLVKENKEQNSVKIGDYVMVKTMEVGLLKKRYSGPWKVCCLLPNNNLEIQMKNKRIRRNIHQVKKFKGNRVEETDKPESILRATTDKPCKAKLVSTNQIQNETNSRIFPIRDRKANSKYANFLKF